MFSLYFLRSNFIINILHIALLFDIFIESQKKKFFFASSYIERLMGNKIKTCIHITNLEALILRRILNEN